MKNKLYNYIFGSLVGLIERNQREKITNQIIDQTKGLKNIYEIEKICKGILIRKIDETMERQAVRVAKDLSRFIVN